MYALYTTTRTKNADSSIRIPPSNRRPILIQDPSNRPKKTLEDPSSNRKNTVDTKLNIITHEFALVAECAAAALEVRILRVKTSAQLPLHVQVDRHRRHDLQLFHAL